ncbi:MAG: glycosyltransferase family 87 protein [Propionibacteriaceae bacterium]
MTTRADVDDIDAPVEADGFAQMMQRRLGSARSSVMGRHARHAGIFFAALPWTIITATLTWFFLALRQAPCLQRDVSKPVNAYYRLCYSDLPVLYQTRGLGAGTSPFGLEYPVLTNAFIGFSRSLALMFGAKLSPSDSQQVLASANIFAAVNALLLFFCFLVVCAACVEMGWHHRQFDVLMVSTAPVVLAAGLVSWDLFGVALATLGTLCWSRKRPLLAGVLWGLGAAAVFHPLLFVIPVICLCLRAERIEELSNMLVGFMLAFGIPLALVNFFAPQQAAVYWTSLFHRSAELGSFWYVLKLMGVNPTTLGAVQVLLLIVGVVAVAWLCFFAPRRPRLGQVLFLAVAFFLIVNKVYSPQFVLWLVPLLFLARPQWREWIIWSIAEVAYFVAVWGHLSGKLLAGGSASDRIYWLAVLCRIGVLMWLCAKVITQMYHSETDPLRIDGDDPIGGVLRGCDDAAWVVRLQDLILGERIIEDVDSDEYAEESAENAPTQEQDVVDDRNNTA